LTSEKEQFYIQRIAELEKQVAELMEQVGKLTDKVAKLSKNSSRQAFSPR
jgi:predicted  nucleic acid-binding Zn-ribbon protein